MTPIGLSICPHVEGQVQCGVSALTVLPFFNDAYHHIVTGGTDKDIYIWRANKDGKATTQIVGERYHTTRISALSWFDHQQKLISGSLDEKIGLWDLSDRRLVGNWRELSKVLDVKMM